MILRELCDALIQEIESKDAEYARLDARSTTLDEFAAKTQKEKEDLAKERTNMAAERAEIQKEKDYITQSLDKVREIKIIEERLETKRIHLNLQGEEIKKDEERLAEHRKLVEGRIAKLAELDKKDSELREREQIMSKKEAVLDVRNESILIKEKQLKDEADRLQKIASRFKR